MAAAMTNTPWRASSRATKPMRRTLVSRSSLENPRPFDRCVRIWSPSRISTEPSAAAIRGPMACARVVLPEQGRPVSQRMAPANFRLFLQRNEMQAALCLLAAAPPARAWILARHHRAGARHAANAGIVPIVERIVGHVMLAHVRLYVVERPAHERVDLDEAEAAVPGGDRRAGALGRLVAPDRCNPGVVSRQRRAQGQHLSLLAAAIGVAAPELGPLV